MALTITPRQLDVLRLIRDRQTITRSEIAAITGLSVSQVSRLTAQLKAKDLIAVEQHLSATEGRPTELLALAPDRRHLIGMDIGGVSQEAVVSNLRGEIVASVSTQVPLSGSQQDVVDHIRAMTADLLASSVLPASQILGIGIGLRAIVDPVSGVISAGPETPGWSQSWANFAIRDALSRMLPWQRITVDDTVRALGAAERRYGNGDTEADFVYLLADTGIGAAIMIDGRPYIGAARIAGEVGHLILDFGGNRCSCGKSGCLETVASIGVMVAHARAIAGDDVSTIDDLTARANAGDVELQAILAAGGHALGRAMAVMLNLLAPSTIVLGGRATQSDDYFEQAVRACREHALDQVAASARIVRSALGPMAGARGAGAMALDAIFDTGSGRSTLQRNGAPAHRRAVKPPVERMGA
jgi:predicted NBD/HSP70 family sugar kinase